MFLSLSMSSLLCIGVVDVAAVTILLPSEPYTAVHVSEISSVGGRVADARVGASSHCDDDGDVIEFNTYILFCRLMVKSMVLLFMMNAASRLYRTSAPAHVILNTLSRLT